jgi:outer membrane immunogenic protein
MKKLVLGVFSLVALGLAVPAAAADLPWMYTKAPLAPAAYDWNGIYIGINGGLGTSRNCWDFTTPAGAFIATEGCHDATGGVLGGQVGYRWQFRSWVFGVEAQGDWANLRGSNLSQFIPIFTNESRIDGLGLLTGQIGYALNNILLYAKSGAAVTKTRYQVTSGGALAATAPDQTRWGGVIGGGLEWGFLPNWSVAVEYDHLFLPDKLVSFTDSTFGGLFGTDRIHQDVDLATLRLNYHWPVH